MDTTPFNDVTYRIIGAAMKVHNGLGPGLKEAFYQRALSLEMEEAGLSYSCEYAVEVHLDEVRVGLLYLDHLVKDEVVAEEKALPHMLTNEEIAQVITYLCATGKKVGLLINFGRGNLEYKRILRPKHVARWSERIKRYAWVPRQRTPVGPRLRDLAQSANPLSNPLTANPLASSTPRPLSTLGSPADVSAAGLDSPPEAAKSHTPSANSLSNPLTANPLPSSTLLHEKTSRP